MDTDPIRAAAHDIRDDDAPGPTSRCWERRSRTAARRAGWRLVTGYGASPRRAHACGFECPDPSIRLSGERRVFTRAKPDDREDELGLAAAAAVTGPMLAFSVEMLPLSPDRRKRCPEETTHRCRRHAPLLRTCPCQRRCLSEPPRIWCQWVDGQAASGFKCEVLVASPIEGFKRSYSPKRARSGKGNSSRDHACSKSALRIVRAVGAQGALTDEWRSGAYQLQ